VNAYRFVNVSSTSDSLLGAMVRVGPAIGCAAYEQGIQPGHSRQSSCGAERAAMTFLLANYTRCTRAGAPCPMDVLFEIKGSRSTRYGCPNGWKFRSGGAASGHRDTHSRCGQCVRSGACGFTSVVAGSDESGSAKPPSVRGRHRQDPRPRQPGLRCRSRKP
jgi:hypothetical protein